MLALGLKFSGTGLNVWLDLTLWELTEWIAALEGINQGATHKSPHQYVTV